MIPPVAAYKTEPQPLGVQRALGKLPAIGLAISLTILAASILTHWRKPADFDDAYMFFRYVINIKKGVGASWNPDGIPTYGMTSQLWWLWIFPWTFLHISPAHTVQLASWTIGILALAALVYGVREFSQSDCLHSTINAAAIVTVPFAFNSNFDFQLVTGMDTMLSLLATTLFVLALLRFMKRPGDTFARMAGLFAFIAFLARPENAMCVLLSSLLAWWRTAEARRSNYLIGLLVFPIAMIAGDLVICRFYFGTAVPLSFYIKARHGYNGFVDLGGQNAVAYLFIFLSVSEIYLVLLFLSVSRRESDLMLVFVLPAVITACYLLTVLQIMGNRGRFYIPLLPFIVLPATLSFDRLLVSNRGGFSLSTRRLAFVLTIVLVLNPAFMGSIVFTDLYAQMTVPRAISIPRLVTNAKEPLPLRPWFETISILTDSVVARLPDGAVVAASEVGYLGAQALQVKVVDLSGVNDNQIAFHGFSMDYLLSQQPDLIWFPHLGYIGMRSAILGDPRLFAQYEVVDGAFNYGIAIRKGSSLRPQIESDVRRAWTRLYPNFRFEDYVVRGR